MFMKTVHEHIHNEHEHERHSPQMCTGADSYLAEFSNYAELCTFEYTWSTAEEGTSSIRVVTVW